MKVTNTEIEGVMVIIPNAINIGDDVVYEVFSQSEFNEKVKPVKFVQDNEAKSTYGVVRGLHFQKQPYSQSKLVRCVDGAILDIAVDIRKESKTYGKHVAVELTGDNHKEFFIPKGFAHGYVVLSETAVVQYKCDEVYHPEAEDGINILDDSLKIDLQIPMDKVIFSHKDKKYKKLADKLVD